MSRAYRTSDGKQIRLAYAGGGYRSRHYSISLKESSYVKKAYDNLIADLNNELLIINEFITECFERKEEKVREFWNVVCYLLKEKIED